MQKFYIQCRETGSQIPATREQFEEVLKQIDDPEQYKNMLEGLTNLGPDDTMIIEVLQLITEEQIKDDTAYITI